MTNKKPIWALIIILLLITFAYTILRANRTTKPEYSAFQAAVNYQKASKEKDWKKLWELTGKVSLQLEGEYVFEKFKEVIEEWIRDDPEAMQAFLKARFEKTKVITPNRAWVEASSPSERFKGLHMVKEDGRWKHGHLAKYILTIMRDIQLLNDAIKNYYKDKNYLPYNLSEPISYHYIENLPLDPFSDEGKTYIYQTISGTTWRIYSIGIDGHNDFGLIEYPVNLNYGPSFGYATGDIIREGKVE